MQHLRAGVKTLFVTFAAATDPAAVKGGLLQKSIDVICSENGRSARPLVVRNTDALSSCAHLNLRRNQTQVKS
jgi:hypothetical protein